MVGEAMCTWPDGQKREVMVCENDGANAKIIWNERVDTGCAAVTGMDEIVPSKWLVYKEYTESDIPPPVPESEL